VAKRVSLKGRGADIFFGGDAPTESVIAAAEPLAVPDASPPLARESADIGEPSIVPDDVPSKQPFQRTRARTDARVHARTEALMHAEMLASQVGALRRRLQAKQRLASQTFRFQTEELEELDRIFEQVKQTTSATISKNDLVRLGLNWLLAEYQERGEESLLASVLRRT